MPELWPDPLPDPRPSAREAETVRTGARYERPARIFDSIEDGFEAGRIDKFNLDPSEANA